ncbi:hypothetical protein Esti_005595 [Eimeria stiedai]
MSGHWQALQQQQQQRRQEQQHLLQQLHHRQQQRDRQQQQQQQEQQERLEAAEQLPSVPYACSSSSSSRSFFEWLKANDVDEQLWRCAWGPPPSATSSSSSSSSSPILVVDAGSHCIRVSRAERGPEGEELSVVLPQLVRKPWVSVGDGCLPEYRGTVKDWISYENAIVEILTAADSGLDLEGVGGQLLWCESSLRSPLHFGRVGEVAFELLEAQRFLSVDKDTLSALAISASLLSPLEVFAEVLLSSSSSSRAVSVLRSMQRFTGLVVDMGASLLRVCPILSGVAVGCLAAELPLGGRDIDAFLCSKIQQQQQLQQLQQRRDGRPCDCAVAAARRIKEQLLCCAVESGVVLATETSLAKTNLVTALSDLHFMPLQTAVAAVIERCPVDTRRCLLQNVFVVGGTSLIPGVAARLQNELREVYRHRKAHASFSPRVHVLPHPELQQKSNRSSTSSSSCCSNTSSNSCSSSGKSSSSSSSSKAVVWFVFIILSTVPLSSKASAAGDAFAEAAVNQRQQQQQRQQEQ